MIFCIKNYCKNRNSSLVAKSVKHFGNYKVYLFNVYPDKIDETGVDRDLFEDIVHTKAKYNFGPGVGSTYNGYYFTEGINLIYNHFKDTDEKVVILDEDHFFTTGKVIKELEQNEFDFAWAYWPAPNTGNMEDVAGNIMCIRPSRLSSIFPIPEKNQYIEILLRENLLNKTDRTKVYQIKNRHWVNYYGDGVFTNDLPVIERELKKVGII